MWTVGTRIGWSLILAGALLMALMSASYYSFDPDVYFQREVYEDKTLGLMVHISAMMFALLAGPFQFLRVLRQRHLSFHRLLGRVYIGGAIVGALSGLYLAPSTASGAVSDVGFALLGLGVLISTTVAVLRIREGKVQSHREWMTRSYALIFGAVMLRVYLLPLQSLVGDHAGYAITAWAAWVPNLFVAEWLIRSRLRPVPVALSSVEGGRSSSAPAVGTPSSSRPR